MVDQIDDLHASFKHFGGGGLIFKERCWTMNGHLLFELNWPELVYWLADHVHHAPERTRANGNRKLAHPDRWLSCAHHAVGRLHCDAAHAPFAEMLLHFEDDVDGCGHLKPFVDNLSAS